jgi:hypothetical protein
MARGVCALRALVYDEFKYPDFIIYMQLVHFVWNEHYIHFFVYSLLYNVMMLLFEYSVYTQINNLYVCFSFRLLHFIAILSMLAVLHVANK